MDWRELTAEALDGHYNPRLAVPDFEDHIAAMQRLSAETRAQVTHIADLRYGDGPLQTLDVFPAPGGAAPVNVFIHGGYWRALDKNDHSFVAPPMVGAGAVAVIINYDLCPAVSLDVIVDEVIAAIAWVARGAAAWGGDASRLFVSGHSAGAHLAAMAIAHDWAADGLAPDLIKGAALVSGIYDPEPVLHIPVNDEIGLDAETAERNNACRRPPQGDPALLVAVGAAETEGWIAQSRAYLASTGAGGDVMLVPGANHFSLAYEMASADRPLCAAMLAQMGLA